MLHLLVELAGYTFDEVRKLQRAINPHREVFTDEAQAKARERELVDQGCLVVLEDFLGAGGGTKLLVRGKSRIRQFRRVCPKRAAKIEQILEPARRIFLSAVEIVDLVWENGMTDQFAERLLAFERQRVGLPTKEITPGTL